LFQIIPDPDPVSDPAKVLERRAGLL